jgi:hypothetical protein
MNACTENYECLVLDNTSKSNRVQDCVFWYKAKLRHNFRVGSPALWQCHRKNYNPKYDTEADGDPRKAKKATALTIVKKK